MYEVIIAAGICGQSSDFRHDDTIMVKMAHKETNEQHIWFLCNIVKLIIRLIKDLGLHVS